MNKFLSSMQKASDKNRENAKISMKNVKTKAKKLCKFKIQTTIM